MGKEDEIIDEIVDKYNWGKLAENNLPGREDILLVSRLLEVNPKTVLTQMRNVVESFVNFLYQQEEGGTTTIEDNQINLDKKIKTLKDSGQLSGLIHLHINTVRIAGNIGSHPDQIKSEQAVRIDSVQQVRVDYERQVRALIPAFVEVVRWFVEEKLEKLLGGIMQAAREKPKVPATPREIRDDFVSNLLAPHWAVLNKSDHIAVVDGVLGFNVGWFTDWWEPCADAPYMLLRDQDYVNHEYTAELVYVRNFPAWPNQMQAGLLLMEARPDWFPNPKNVFMWGVKIFDNARLFTVDELRQNDPNRGPCQGTSHFDWKHAGGGTTGSNLPLVIRARQVRDSTGWKYIFEVATNFDEPALFSQVLGPYARPHHIGIFAKNFNIGTTDFTVGFQAFRLTIG